MVSGRPILALTPSDSIAAELIQKTNSGYIVGFDDKASIKKMLIEILNKYKNSGLNIEQDRGNLRQYKRKLLTRKLAQIFDSVVMPKRVSKVVNV